MIQGISGAIIKFERAIEHVQQLGSMIGLYVHPDAPPFDVIEDRSRHSGEIVYRARNIRKPPPILGAIAGDAIHNIKSGLEILWRWSIDTSGRRSVSFPWVQSAEELRARFKGNEKGRTKTAVKCLFEINPCEDWITLLWRLSIADNSDKHHVITPAIGANKSMFTEDSGGQVDTVGFYERIVPLYPIEEDTELLRFCPNDTSERELKVKPRFTAYVAFGDVFGKHGECLATDGVSIVTRINQWLEIATVISERLRSAGLFDANLPPSGQP